MKIGYSKTYPVTVYWEKNWLEEEFPTGLTLDSTDEEIAEVMKKVRRIQYALKAQVEAFHYEAMAAAEKHTGTKIVDIPYQSEISGEQLSIDEENNKQFEHVKKMLKKHKFKEDAQEYLNDTGFQLNVECKSIVNNLPSNKDKK